MPGPRSRPSHRPLHDRRAHADAEANQQAARGRLSRPRRLPFDWLLLGLFGAVLLAFLFPATGGDGSPVTRHQLNQAAVALVFFLHGANLPNEALRAGGRLWRVHLLVQTFTFVVSPLLGLATITALGSHFDGPLRIGVLYLSALPSTISSAVALTASAGGRVAVAIFNATLSSLLAIVLTPSWLALGGEQLSFPLAQIFLGLLQALVLPLALGQLLRPLIKGWITRHRFWLRHVDRCVILLLVYTAFGSSVAYDVWSGFAWSTLLATVVLCALALLGLMSGMAWLGLRLGFEASLRKALVFCASQKSLAVGVPMAQLVFTNDPHLGIILLPIMVYHPLQLILGAVIATRWAPPTAGSPDTGEEG